LETVHTPVQAHSSRLFSTQLWLYPAPPTPLQILKQVSELHALNLTHGDIKLTNILVKVCPVTGDLTDVQLADFGSVTYMAGAAAKYIM
jgi:serine/threonine protein kinase